MFFSFFFYGYLLEGGRAGRGGASPSLHFLHVSLFFFLVLFIMYSRPHCAAVHHHRVMSGWCPACSTRCLSGGEDDVVDFFLLPLFSKKHDGVTRPFSNVLLYLSVYGTPFFASHFFLFVRRSTERWHLSFVRVADTATNDIPLFVLRIVFFAVVVISFFPDVYTHACAAALR